MAVALWRSSYLSIRLVTLIIVACRLVSFLEIFTNVYFFLIACESADARAAFGGSK